MTDDGKLLRTAVYRAAASLRKIRRRMSMPNRPMVSFPGEKSVKLVSFKHQQAESVCQESWMGVVDR